MKKTKTAFAFFAATAVVCALIAVCAFADAGIGNFKSVNAYKDGQFIDVPQSAWYAESVVKAFELGLVKGKSDTEFYPAGNVTVAETLALACRLNSIYNTGAADFVQGTPWYEVYENYAIKNGIIKEGEFKQLNVNATRSQFAAILSRSLPAAALAEINYISDGAIPDVSASAENAKEIYLLYRAGVLTGNDDKGTFTPNSSIQRSAVAAIVTRMADTSLRRSFTLEAGAELSSEDIYAKCSPAVFYIEVYDVNNQALGSGSGFFIEPSGIAVTNFHVIKDAYWAKILMPGSNNAYEVAGVCDYDKNFDWAVIKVNVNNTAYLERETTAAVGGAKVYAIGSPEGLVNTISEGIVSNPQRVMGGVPYIQTSAAISHGSSGGALIDKYGKVIGITSAGIESGENLGFALPISVIDGYKTDKTVSLSDRMKKDSQYTEQEMAEVCLWHFWKQNANFKLGDTVMYSKATDFLDGYYRFALYYDADYDGMVLYYYELYNGKSYYSRLYLSSGSLYHSLFYYFYSATNNTDDPDCSAYKDLYAPDFDGKTFSFDEIEGFGNRIVQEEKEKDVLLDTLDFANSILAGYNYSMKAFGFKVS
ncbi:MAG: trypsin-like peptidase domain-containing protein [Clostridia bacterium]|nr:trypsin-like peptidase domain-containing protein [Clostridia bacterium]